MNYFYTLIQLYVSLPVFPSPVSTLPREGLGALHHGYKPLGHFGAGVSDAEAPSLSHRRRESCDPEPSHLPQQELPVSAAPPGPTAGLQEEHVCPRLTFDLSLSLSHPLYLSPSFTSVHQRLSNDHSPLISRSSTSLSLSLSLSLKTYSRVQVKTIVFVYSLADI